MRGRSIEMGCLAVAIALGSASGCSNDLGGIEDVGTETASGLASDTTDPASDPDGTSGLGGAEDGTGGDTSPETASCELDCGAGGYCEFDEGGGPVCVCDEGYAAYGLRCLPCTTTDGIFDLEIPSTTVHASFTLRGAAFPGSYYQHGRILLRDPATGDEIVLGSTLDGGTPYGVQVIPGAYEVHYARRAGGTQVPANRSARLTTVEIPHGDRTDLVIDVPAVALSGAILMNGAAPPTGLYENGSIVLREPNTGDEIVLGDTRDAAYTVMVVPGRYDVHYRRKLAAHQAPINQDARFATIEVDGDGAQVLELDVPVTTLSGSFTLDGAAPPTGVYENGRIVLRNLQTGDEVVLGQTRDGSYAAPVVPGTYEVVYRRLLGGNLVPVNQAAVLESVTLEPGARVLDVDIPTAVVTGTITVGGVPAPADPADDGLVLLRNPQTGDEALLGNTADGTYSRRVVVGSYDVFYRQETSSGGVPVNTNAKLQPLVIAGGAAFDVDVPMVTVSATVTVGGALPPESAYDDGLLYLRNAQTGDSVLLGNTRLASLERPIVPGTYDLVYVVEAAGPTMPINTKAHLATLNLGQAAALAIDIPVAPLSGAITLGGDPPTTGAYDRAVIVLHDVDTADVIDLGSIGAGAYTRTITAGTYVVAYHGLATTGLVPANTHAGIACVELLAP